ncbi:uncharacterized protein LOC115532064 isoform X5 [Gadus morhua]|uniref:uncharacterized protein LOC115532064 isoform X5 n=1 Tax=Gadus morhua TaxID=8049 RepID=UPI0011B39C4E|nr:uncharacterized protein LOC115532064 isoform X5 [Gadus morhua]
MDLACSVVVLLMSCVFGSPVPSLDVNREGVQPVDDRPIPIDSNSTGLYEDRYDENTTLWNRNSTGLYEDRYDENSTLADRNKTGDDDILRANRTNTGPAKETDYEIKVQGWNPSSTRDAPPLITRQETLPRCFLSTCLVHHLPNLLQTGDETAGDKTKDIHGPG